MGCGCTRGRADEVTAFPYPAFATEDSLDEGYPWAENCSRIEDGVSSTTLPEYFKPKLRKCMTRSTFQSSQVDASRDYDERANFISQQSNDSVELIADLSQAVGPLATPHNSIFRPDRIVFIRHGESEANVDRAITARVPDHAVHLTAKGREQALKCGEMLAEIVGENSVSFIVSPYVRTRETFHGIARSFGPVEELSVRLDAQVREQDHGNFDRPEMRELMKEKGEFGQFYYRFPEGESMADVYDRASIFLESLYRRWEFSREKNLVIVSHGLYILVFFMRLFRYNLDDLYSLEPLRNCEMIVLERLENAKFYDIAYTWSPGFQKDFGGLRRRPAELLQQPLEIWDGDPDADLLVSQPAKRTNKMFLGLAWAPTSSVQEPMTKTPSGNSRKKVGAGSTSP